MVVQLNYGRKKSDINYQIVSEIPGTKITDYCDIKKSPEWWKNLSVFRENTTTQKWVSKHWNKIIGKIDLLPTQRTIKGCPASQDFLSRSFLLKLPCDVMLETHADGSYKWRAWTNNFKITDHDIDQVSGSHLANDWIILKFMLPIIIQSDNNMCYFQDCLLEKVQPWRCANGMADLDVPRELNVILLFPKEDKKYYLKRGEPICSLVFFNKFKKVIEKDLSVAYYRYGYKINSTIMGAATQTTKEF